MSKFDEQKSKTKIVDISSSTPRINIDSHHVETAMDDIIRELQKQIKAKGSHGFASSHEILGVLEEELYEAKMAVHHNDRVDFMKELAQVAVACIWGIASNEGNSLDW